MATRAIYQIENLQFYNHWDNYPQGAALYFLDVFKKYEKMDVLSFIRGVESVEILSPNNFNIGEEYVYTLYLSDSKEIENPENKNLNAEEWIIEAYWVNNHWSAERSGIGEVYSKTLLYRGLLVEWINEQLINRFPLPEERENNTLVRLAYNTITTLAIAKEKIIEMYEKAVKHYEKEMIGNSTSTFHDCFKMANFSGIEIPEQKNEYINLYAPIFAEKYGHNTPDYFISYVNDK